MLAVVAVDHRHVVAVLLHYAAAALLGAAAALLGAAASAAASAWLLLDAAAALLDAAVLLGPRRSLCGTFFLPMPKQTIICLLYTSDAADE